VVPSLGRGAPTAAAVASIDLGDHAGHRLRASALGAHRAGCTSAAAHTGRRGVAHQAQAGRSRGAAARHAEARAQVGRPQRLSVLPGNIVLFATV